MITKSDIPVTFRELPIGSPLIKGCYDRLVSWISLEYRASFESLWFAPWWNPCSLRQRSLAWSHNNLLFFHCFGENLFWCGLCMVSTRGFAKYGNVIAMVKLLETFWNNALQGNFVVNLLHVRRLEFMATNWRNNKSQEICFEENW